MLKSFVKNYYNKKSQYYRHLVRLFTQNVLKNVITRHNVTDKDLTVNLIDIQIQHVHFLNIFSGIELLLCNWKFEMIKCSDFSLEWL